MRALARVRASKVLRPLHTLFLRRLLHLFLSPFAAQVLKRLTSSVSCALDEAAAALTRMRSDPPGGGAGGGGGATGGGAPTSGSASAASSAGTADSERSLVEACNEGDINKVGTSGNRSSSFVVFVELR